MINRLGDVAEDDAIAEKEVDGWLLLLLLTKWLVSDDKLMSVKSFVLVTEEEAILEEVAELNGDGLWSEGGDFKADVAAVKGLVIGIFELELFPIILLFVGSMRLDDGLGVVFRIDGS